ncbi:MAG TPA: lysophospholipid acyltransferase family protein, partial [Catalimonadaceae bacterium]|nr:lysophospholipid acyltransferase family protein [Catalimonadaceae bacterium]
TFWWLFGFLFLFPFFALCIWIPRIQSIMPLVNQIWCLIFFPMAFLRVKTSGRNHIPKNQPVIYCSNHGSFMDIPLLTYVLPGFPAFMGKASLGRIPVFGFMFRNLHIVVERGSTQGRVKALKISRKMLKRGRSIIVFPEGSIHHKIQPGLADFKDGAFKLAIQTGAPIVPITICFNWFILPDDGRWLPNFYHCKTIIHPPISTNGLVESDWNLLKMQTFEVINKSLHSENGELVNKLNS